SVRSARALFACIAAATSSLPTPLSPVISTFASDRATRSISSASSRMGELSPMSGRYPFCPLYFVIPRSSVPRRRQKRCERPLSPLVERHERRGHAIARSTGVHVLVDPPHFHLGGEPPLAEPRAQLPACAWRQRRRRGERRAAHADVAQLDVRPRADA